MHPTPEAPTSGIPPVERPRGLFMRLAWRASRKQFGEVIGPMKVIYARRPGLLLIAMLIHRTFEKGISLEPALRLLIQVQASRLNGCAFCEDLALATALRQKVGSERFAALEDFRTSGLFTEREKAALAFTEETTLHRHVSPATFAEARRHFSDDEVVELAWVNAAESYFNLQAHPLGIGADGLRERAAAEGRAG